MPRRIRETALQTAVDHIHCLQMKFKGTFDERLIVMVQSLLEKKWKGSWRCSTNIIMMQFNVPVNRNVYCVTS